jgi:transcriptional regulator with XRE-family HTH domain
MAMKTTDTRDRMKAMRKRLNLTQEAVADKSGGVLERVEVSKVESGKNQARADRVRQGFATAFGITRDRLAAYLDGDIDLDEALRPDTVTITTDPDDVYPNRARAIAAARLLMFDERDIAVVAAVPGFKSDVDPEPAWWHARIVRARDERLDDERLGAPAGTTAKARLSRTGKVVLITDPRLPPRFRGPEKKKP